jgi:hypothetical protein
MALLLTVASLCVCALLIVVLVAMLDRRSSLADRRRALGLTDEDIDELIEEERKR